MQITFQVHHLPVRCMHNNYNLYPVSVFDLRAEAFAESASGHSNAAHLTLGNSLGGFKKHCLSAISPPFLLFGDNM